MVFTFFFRSGRRKDSRSDAISFVHYEDDFAIEAEFVYDRNNRVRNANVGNLVGFIDQDGNWQVFDITSVEMDAFGDTFRIQGQHVAVTALKNNILPTAAGKELSTAGVLEIVLDGTIVQRGLLEEIGTEASTTRSVTLYKSPGSGTITTLATDTLVYVIEQPDGSYWKVETTSGTVGYINKSYLVFRASISGGSTDLPSFRITSPPSATYTVGADDALTVEIGFEARNCEVTAVWKKKSGSTYAAISASDGANPYEPGKIHHAFTTGSGRFGDYRVELTAVPTNGSSNLTAQVEFTIEEASSGGGDSGGGSDGGITAGTVCFIKETGPLYTDPAFSSPTNTVWWGTRATVVGIGSNIAIVNLPNDDTYYYTLPSNLTLTDPRPVYVATNSTGTNMRSSPSTSSSSNIIANIPYGTELRWIRNYDRNWDYYEVYVQSKYFTGYCYNTVVKPQTTAQSAAALAAFSLDDEDAEIVVFDVGSNTGTQKQKINTIDKEWCTSWDALQEWLAPTCWWLRPDVTLTAEGDRIASIKLGMFKNRETPSGLRLTCDYNIRQMGVTYDCSNIYTRVYGLGKGGIDFGSVVWTKDSTGPNNPPQTKPSGQKWVENNSADIADFKLLETGERYGLLKFEDISSKDTLLETVYQTMIAEHSVPEVSIDCSIGDLYALGYSGVPIRLHDKVLVELQPIGEQIWAHVIGLERDLIRPERTRPIIGKPPAKDIIYTIKATKKKR